ncbi:hypothetical protein C0J52_21091 [Blattella germanica]|nr:hypothetical protein C0J52_21091 [Blattella germanica]
MICSWIIVSLSAEVSLHPYYFTLALTVLISLHMWIWDNLFWTTLSDIMTDMIIISSRQRPQGVFEALVEVPSSVEDGTASTSRNISSEASRSSSAEQRLDGYESSEEDTGDSTTTSSDTL